MRVVTTAEAVNKILNRIRVETVITLYDTNLIPHINDFTRREVIANALTSKVRGLGMDYETAVYWLDYFKVQPVSLQQPTTVETVDA